MLDNFNPYQPNLEMNYPDVKNIRKLTKKPTPTGAAIHKIDMLRSDKILVYTGGKLSQGRNIEEIEKEKLFTLY